MYYKNERYVNTLTFTFTFYLQWPTNRKWYMIYRTAPFSVTFRKTPTPGFKVMPFFDAEYVRIQT